MSLEGEARLLPGEAWWKLMVQILLLAHKFSGEDQKKKIFGAKS